MPLLRLNALHLAYGHHVLLDGADLQIRRGDRICLVGRNGAGKSTLLKLVAGDIAADEGSVWRHPDLVIARLEQDLPEASETTVYDVVATGLADLGQLLADYHHAADQGDMDRLADLQQQLEARDGWRFQQRIEQTLTRLNLPAEQPLSSLSGGWRRRVALARALVAEPDLLLLDEPTNHLDIAAIEWLEQELLNYQGAVLFITHDRALLRKLATAIVELDRGQLKHYPCDYDRYLAQRAHELEVEEQHNALFDKRLAAEEVWIRQGIKARRTRNEGRVRALKALREERAQRRQQTGTARIAVETASASGKQVIELDQVSFSYGGKLLIDRLSLIIQRGDKVGLLGPNGVGKSTLLKLMLGELQPTSGKLKQGSKLEIAYFDQMRSLLDNSKTIVDVVGQGRDSVTINGKTRHIMSYLGDFLFSPERARTPIRALSGGECNRVQLACLFSQPANLLVMDEPTNDLDMETLELLETILVEFTGTVLLVSHDRDFMDNVVTSTLAFEGNGKVIEYVGGYQDWLRQGGHLAAEPSPGSTSPAPVASGSTGSESIRANPADTGSNSKPRKKLSYKLQRELDQLPAQIDALEQQLASLQETIANPGFYQQDQQAISSALAELSEVQEKLDATMERWLELADE